MSLQPGAPVDVMRGTYKGHCGTIARLTAEQVYVCLEDGSTVRIAQSSVRVTNARAQNPHHASSRSSTRPSTRTEPDGAPTMAAGAGVDVVRGTYKGHRGLVIRLTRHQVYVCLEDGSTVRIAQSSVSTTTTVSTTAPSRQEQSSTDVSGTPVKVGQQVKVVRGTYCGDRGVVTKLTQSMIYVLLEGSRRSVRIRQTSVEAGQRRDTSGSRVCSTRVNSTLAPQQQPASSASTDVQRTPSTRRLGRSIPPVSLTSRTTPDMQDYMQRRRQPPPAVRASTGTRRQREPPERRGLGTSHVSSSRNPERGFVVRTVTSTFDDSTEGTRRRQQEANATHSSTHTAIPITRSPPANQQSTDVPMRRIVTPAGRSFWVSDVLYHELTSTRSLNASSAHRFARARSGAIESQIRSLPVSIVHNPNNLPSKCRQCAICLQDFQRGSERKILPCIHGFHTDCIDQWLRDFQTSCPCCRSSLAARSR